MIVPRSGDARLFYRCAFQRFDEAEVLFNAGYSTGAVYLAGYAVECILKAIVLESIPESKREATLSSFRGNKGHDFEWLRSLYLTNGGAKLPVELNQNFTLVSDWSTDLRYDPQSIRTTYSQKFLKAAATILQWADRRI